MAKYIKTQDLLNQDTLTYQQILNIKKRLNGYAKSAETDEALDWKDEYSITQDHTDKGLEYLFRVAFKPSKLGHQREVYDKQGLIDEAIRSNSPLGYRELNILLQFDHFSFVGLQDMANHYQMSMGLHNYVPVWRTYDKDGYSFEYYLNAGEMVIIG